MTLDKVIWQLRNIRQNSDFQWTAHRDEPENIFNRDVEAIDEVLDILIATKEDGWVQLAKEEKRVFYNTKARMGVIMREKV